MEEAFRYPVVTVRLTKKWAERNFASLLLDIEKIKNHWLRSI
jgi:hypothetical protein